MQITACDFKNIKGFLLENNTISVVVLPELGGKIASFKYKKNDFELLFQNPKNRYLRAQVGSDFSEYDASGFDDCFPNISQEEVLNNEKLISYPDHGEIWSTLMEANVTLNRLELKMKSQILPYSFSKTLGLKDNRLIIHYKISNFGTEPIDCFYTMHCLVNCDEEMVLEFPKDTKYIVNVLESSRLGNEGTIHPYPLTKSHKDEIIDFRKVQAAAKVNCEKFYVANIMEEGKCRIDYPKQGIRFTLAYDPKKLPYLGFWVTEGGFRGDYNCAFEPSNGFYDGIGMAKKNNKYLKLMPNETFQFEFSLELEKRD